MATGPRQAKIVRPKGTGYRIQFRDPMPGDVVVVRLDKRNVNGDKYVELELGEKTGRGTYAIRS